MRDSAQHWCQWICLTVLQMLISRAKVKNMHCAACWKILKSPLIYFFSHISFCIGQLQFLQHQMQQQQMAMGAAAAPQGAAPRQHTASQPRSKRKRSTPQPLSKSWQSEITLNPSPGYTRTWMIHTVLFVCLTVETKRLFFVLSVCLFLADKCVCNGCLKSWRTKTLSTIEKGLFLEEEALHLKNHTDIFWDETEIDGSHR